MIEETLKQSAVHETSKGTVNRGGILERRMRMLHRPPSATGGDGPPSRAWLDAVQNQRFLRGDVRRDSQMRSVPTSLHPNLARVTIQCACPIQRASVPQSVSVLAVCRR